MTSKEHKKEYKSKQNDKQMDGIRELKQLVFDYFDQYMVEYNPKQIANSNRLYQYVCESIGHVPSLKYSRYLNEYKKKRSG